MFALVSSVIGVSKAFNSHIFAWVLGDVPLHPIVPGEW